MYPYQQQYQPMYRDYFVGQAAPAAPPAAPSVPARSTQSTGMKVAETILTVGFSGAVAYNGIRAGMNQKGLNSAAGWVAGVGGSVLGLVVLTSIVSPPLARTINTFRFA